MKRKVEIMGIVNLTEDSYFPESRCSSVASVLERVSLMLDEGADIIDIGACSSRPGSLPAGAGEEWRRLKPVLPALLDEFPGIRISIDTYWASIVSRAYDLAGDFIVNDISAGEDDPMMLPTVGKLGLRYIAMHKRGTPLDMQERCDYEDVVSDVAAYFESFAAKASDAGISDWILDPGFGFAKTLEQNYELLGGLGRLCRSYGGHTPRILVGVSRKSMIRNLLGISVEDSLPATQAVHMAALINGADILRVHDVKEAVQTVHLYNSMP